MLSKLYISNYALIDKLSIDFKDGFTVITGETGAGKSIILGALSLILGQRANLSGLGDSRSKAIVEGWFNLTGYGLKSFFKDKDLDYEENTCFRREILPSGKSRAFINDTPVSLSTMKALGTKLVDIHSQHETQLLINPSYQLSFLDRFSGISKQVAVFSDKFDAWRLAVQELESLSQKAARSRQDEDYIGFQLKELYEAGLDDVGLAASEQQLTALENADIIKEALGKVSFLLGDADVNALELIRQASEDLQRIREFNSGYEALSDRLSSVIIELEDLRSECEVLESSVDNDPLKLEQLRDRLDVVNRLLFKHQVNEVAQLLELKKEYELRLSQIQGYDEAIAAQRTVVNKLKNDLITEAEVISSKRKAHIKKLAGVICEGLNKLGMPDAEVAIAHRELDTFNRAGLDEIHFLFSANKGFKPQDLSKVASGGERSRLMLVLKNVMAKLSKTPTLILDEIDTGISGEVAAKTADMLREMAANTQLIAITHLPQVAGKATHHFKVVKETDKEKSRTALFRLSDEQRIDEVARLISGESITDAAVDHAQQLIK